MLQTFKALIEIIMTSFGTQSLRCTRAAFWLCVLAAFVVGIIAASVTIMTAIFIPTLGGIFVVMTSLYLWLASIWLTVLTARRIRDVGYRALYFYLYAIITGILGFLSQFGDLNLDELNELLATLLGIVMLIVHIWILLLCVKPTSPVAEERFGVAMAYSFDMEKLLSDLKKFVALGIVASAIGGIIILIGILGKEAFIDKKDGCYLSAGNTNRYLGKLKNEFNKDVMQNFVLHFKPKEPEILRHSPTSSTLPQPQYLAPIDFAKFIPDTLDKTQEMQLQCYYDNRQYISLKLKDYLIDGQVALDFDYQSDNNEHKELLVEFAHGQIKDGEVMLDNETFKEQRFYHNGMITRIVYTPQNEREWKPFEVHYENGKLHGEVQIQTDRGTLVIPYIYGLRYGVATWTTNTKNSEQKRCFVLGGFGCHQRIEIHHRRHKTPPFHETTHIYYNRNGEEVSQDEFKKYDALELFFFEDSTPSLARNKKGEELLFENGQALAFIEGRNLYKTTFYYKNGIETFLWSETAGASFNPKHNKNIVNEISYESIFADSSRKCKPSILQKYYNHFMTIPLGEIASSQQNQQTIYMPKNRRELLSLVRDDSVNLGDIDTSKITDMTLLFASFCGNELSTTQFIRGDELPIARVLAQNFTAGERKDFGGIDSWNVNNVWEMGDIFYHSPLQDSPPKWYKGEQ